jgi:hypothetical protein
MRAPPARHGLRGKEQRQAGDRHKPEIKSGVARCGSASAILLEITKTEQVRRVDPDTSFTRKRENFNREKAALQQITVFN